MNQLENMDELIAKHVLGEASFLEKEMVKEWIALSEENKRYYTDCKTVFRLTGLSTDDTKNVEIAWNKLKHSIENKGKKPTLRNIGNLFYNRAAVFILLIGMGYLLLFHFSRTKNKVILTENEIVLSAGTGLVITDTLSDGSLIRLDQKSKLVYSSSFNKKNRDVKLTGNAHFRIRHNEQLPFIINTGDVFIKDMGTSFSIKSNPSDSIVQVSVEEGRVVFYTINNRGIELRETETGIYYKNSMRFEKVVSRFNTLPKLISLRFENTRLKAVVDTLNKAYNAHIVLFCDKLETLELTVTFTETSVQPVVETIAATLGLTILNKKEEIVLTDGSCNP